MHPLTLKDLQEVNFYVHEKKIQLTVISFQGLNFRLAFAISAGAFGSAWQHGYNTGVLNAPQQLITDWIKDCNVTKVEDSISNENTVKDVAGEECMSEEVVTVIWAWVVAAFCVGGIIGGSIVGVVASRLGR